MKLKLTSFWLRISVTMFLARSTDSGDPVILNGFSVSKSAESWMITILAPVDSLRKKNYFKVLGA